MIATKALLSNPAIRKAALGTAAAIAGGLVNRIRQRRAGRARPKRGGGRRAQGQSTSRVQAMPAAYNSVSSGVAGRIRLARREKVQYTFNCNGEDNGSPASMRISPRENIFFPILSEMASSYTRFKFMKLTVEYVPRVGTQASGNVYFGWQPQPAYEDNDVGFPTVSSITSMPVSATTSIRGGMRFPIPIQGGERYVIPPADSPSYDPLNYYNGFFIATAQGDDEDHVGDLWVDYVVDLIEPIRDNTVKTTTANIFTQVVTSPGIYHLQHTFDGTDHSYRAFSNRDMTLMIVSAANAGALPDGPVVLDADGNALPTFYDFGTAVNARRLTTFRIGKAENGVVVKIAPGANAITCGALWAQTVAYF